MKKITHILLLSFIFSGSAWAGDGNVEKILRALLEIDYTVISPQLTRTLDADEPVFIAITLFYDEILSEKNMNLYLNGQNITQNSDISPYYISYVRRTGFVPGNYNAVLMYEDRGIRVQICSFSFEIPGEQIDEPEPEPEPVVALQVDSFPEFMGGVPAMMDYFGRNVAHPITRRNTRVDGMVVVRFVVNPNGSVRDVKIDQSLGPEYDREVMKVLETMATWQPGFSGGRAVAFHYELVVRFRSSEVGRSVEIQQPRYQN